MAVPLNPSDAVGLDKIMELIDWYRKERNWSYHDIDLLLNCARRLATEIFFFADEVGQYHEDKTATEYRRKSAFAKKKAELIEQREKQGEKAVANLIENEVIVLIDEYMKQEALAESAYQRAKMLLDTARDVLQQMQQHISYFKTEKTLEMSGKGGQQT